MGLMTSLISLHSYSCCELETERIRGDWNTVNIWLKVKRLKSGRAQTYTETSHHTLLLSKLTHQPWSHAPITLPEFSCNGVLVNFLDMGKFTVNLEMLGAISLNWGETLELWSVPDRIPTSNNITCCEEKAFTILTTNDTHPHSSQGPERPAGEAPAASLLWALSFRELWRMVLPAGNVEKQEPRAICTSWALWVLPTEACGRSQDLASSHSSSGRIDDFRQCESAHLP